MVHWGPWHRVWEPLQKWILFGSFTTCLKPQLCSICQEPSLLFQKDFLHLWRKVVNTLQTVAMASAWNHSGMWKEGRNGHPCCGCVVKEPRFWFSHYQSLEGKHPLVPHTSAYSIQKQVEGGFAGRSKRNRYMWSTCDLTARYCTQFVSKLFVMTEAEFRENVEAGSRGRLSESLLIKKSPGFDPGSCGSPKPFKIMMMMIQFNWLISLRDYFQVESPQSWCQVHYATVHNTYFSRQ